MLTDLRTELKKDSPTITIRGLMHLAAVLDDATLPKLTRGHLEKAYGAKVWGAKHLRAALASKASRGAQGPSASAPLCALGLGERR